MSSSLKERIVSAVIRGLVLFLVVTILVYKFQIHDRGCLVYSLCWAVPFTIVMLTPTTLVEKEKSMMDAMFHKYIICIAILSALGLIVLIVQQIFEVKFELEKYNEIIGYIWMSFTFSYISNTQRKTD